jgi:hypothetical protein
MDEQGPNRKVSRLRFSIKALLAAVAMVAIGLGGWIGYSTYKLRRLIQLRDEGAIVIIRDRTPRAFRAVGIEQLYPFYSVPTVELYVTPRGADAVVGNNDQLMSKEAAKKCLLQKASDARSYGAEDIQLITIDSFDFEWTDFAREHSIKSIGDNKARYIARLKANQESGANINPNADGRVLRQNQSRQPTPGL